MKRKRKYKSLGLGFVRPDYAEPGTTLDLGQIYENLIASAEKRELESTTMLKYDEKFQIFVALGLVLLICEAFINERRKI